MNQTRKSPVIRPGPGQVWNQSSSSTSNSNSNSNSGSASIYVLPRNQPVQEEKSSIFGAIARVLTCSGNIAHVAEDDAQPPSIQCKFHFEFRIS